MKIDNEKQKRRKKKARKKKKHKAMAMATRNEGEETMMMVMVVVVDTEKGGTKEGRESVSVEEVVDAEATDRGIGGGDELFFLDHLGETEAAGVAQGLEAVRATAPLGTLGGQTGTTENVLGQRRPFAIVLALHPLL